MAYAGLPPALFTNNLTNVQLIDDISGSFNGSTQSFALTSNSAPFHAVSARSLLVTLGGITQKPQVDYTVDGANITFTTPPVSGLTFAARNIYGLNYLNNVNDGVITPAKLSTGAPTWNTGGTVTVSGDLNVTGSFNSGTQGLFWGDNEPANFGNDNDLRIYHDGNDSYISESGTGNLHINTNGSSIRFISDGSTTNGKIADFNRDGSVNLYYDNSKKFETTSAGTLTTGAIGVVNPDYYTANYPWYIRQDSSLGYFSINYYGNVSDFIIRDNGNVGIGMTNPTYKLDIDGVARASIFVSTSYSVFGSIVVNEPGVNYYSWNNRIGGGLAVVGTTYLDGNVGIGTTNPDHKLHVNGSSIGLGTNGGSFNQRILNGGTGNYTIEMDTTERIRITGTGGHLLPGADATQDLGSPTKRWANIYSADLQLSNEGSSNDVDGTWGQYTIQEGENDLFLINRRNGKKYKFVLQEVN